MDDEGDMIQAITDINQFIGENTDFIQRIASNVMKRRITKSDDEYSVAMIAFYEATQKYNESKGEFHAFASVVMRRRVIDNIRHQRKYSPESTVDGIKMDGILEVEETDADALAVQDKVVAKSREDAERITEINAFRENMEHYGITLQDIEKHSPASKKTKAICEDAICYIVLNGLVGKMRKTKSVPRREINRNLGISEKKLERHRKYIIAACEILAGDYPYLGEYLGNAKERIRKERANDSVA